MHEINRDLLLSAKAAKLSPQELREQLGMLNDLLYHIETWETYCRVNEIVDINRRRIITKPHRMQSMLREPRQKAFVFVHNKN
jgi:hypothetical protein